MYCTVECGILQQRRVAEIACEHVEGGGMGLFSSFLIIVWLGGIGLDWVGLGWSVLRDGQSFRSCPPK
jgi:hypothetical protein